MNSELWASESSHFTPPSFLRRVYPPECRISFHVSTCDQQPILTLDPCPLGLQTSSDLLPRGLSTNSLDALLSLELRASPELEQLLPPMECLPSELKDPLTCILCKWTVLIHFGTFGRLVSSVPKNRKKL
jgi:hypothetical protein